MAEPCYLWYELCDTFEEQFSFITNEIDHYYRVFEQNNVRSLKEIAKELKMEINELKDIYNVDKSLLDLCLKNEESDWKLYDEFLYLKYLLDNLWDRFKYIVYAIFNTSLRRRLDYLEFEKVHIVTRDLCKYFQTKIHHKYDVIVEAHFGYDLSYYWIPITVNKKYGVINTPRTYSYCTRHLPINCHEVSHPIIDLNSKEILDEPEFKNAFMAVYDFIYKHFLFLNESYSRKQLENVTSSVFSEIFADIFSVLICSEAFISSFTTSELWPRDKINARAWMIYKLWKYHPPNEFRFRICNEVLKILGKKEEKRAKILEKDWNKISSFQDDVPYSIYADELQVYIDNLIDEFNIKEVVNKLISDNSSIKIVPYKIKKEKTLDDISESDDPIEILNAIWRTRYKRFCTGIDIADRKTTQALKGLYYSLESRRK